MAGGIDGTEKTLLKARDCLRHDHPPEPKLGCPQCIYLSDLQAIGIL
jgi:hypothetical protein